MHNIGEVLVTQREKLGLSLEDAATRLNIRIRYLKAIEAGRFDEIAHQVYLMGYIKTYANFLALDGDEIIAYLGNVYETEQNQIQINEPFIEDFKPGPVIILVSVILIITITVLWYVLQGPPLNKSQPFALTNSPEVMSLTPHLLAPDQQIIKPYIAVIAKDHTTIKLIKSGGLIVKEITLKPHELYFIPQEHNLTFVSDNPSAILIFDDKKLTITTP
jgi:transcriptional regulator with XRE-family HTH domain